MTTSAALSTPAALFETRLSIDAMVSSLFCSLAGIKAANVAGCNERAHAPGEMRSGAARLLRRVGARHIALPRQHREEAFVGAEVLVIIRGCFAVEPQATA